MMANDEDDVANAIAITFTISCRAESDFDFTRRLVVLKATLTASLTFAIVFVVVSIVNVKVNTSYFIFIAYLVVLTYL